MAITYPPAPPTFSGDMQTVNRFLSTPTLVSRRATEIARQRFISDVLLTSRTDVAGGAIVFEQDDPLYVERPVEMVSPGGEYPQTGLADAVPQAVKVNKWGQDVPITDEKIKRSNFAAVEKALTRLVNTAVRNCDSISLSLIASQVTQTQAVTDGAWASSTKILRDIMLAKATIIGLNKGYDPNVLVVDDTTWAYLASDPAIQTARAREDSANTIYTGEFPSIAGLTILPTPNLPTAGAWSSTPTRSAVSRTRSSAAATPARRSKRRPSATRTTTSGRSAPAASSSRTSASPVPLSRSPASERSSRELHRESPSRGCQRADGKVKYLYCGTPVPSDVFQGRHRATCR
ncbi:hypothetical protein GS426_02645 [Rhodococcus hoagii]|nr:hypothetical protein [Prescottella equi]